MWRTVVALLLTFGAVAWSVLAIVVLFLFVPSLAERFFGPAGVLSGAVLVMAGVVWSSGRLMSLADRVLNEADHREPEAPAVGPGDTPEDWREYSAQIAQSKRWAFYRRTRQFQRLAELEAATARGGGAGTPHRGGGSRGTADGAHVDAAGHHRQDRV